ncbi:6142_t:CDS:2, partial [Scutellospora calospora]
MNVRTNFKDEIKMNVNNIYPSTIEIQNISSKETMKTILTELRTKTPVNLKSLPPPYDVLSDLQIQIKTVWKKLSNRTLKNRIYDMIYAFYLGELLALATKSEKNFYIKKLEISRYYVEVSMR